MVLLLYISLFKSYELYLKREHLQNKGWLLVVLRGHLR